MVSTTPHKYSKVFADMDDFFTKKACIFAAFIACATVTALPAVEFQSPDVLEELSSSGRVRVSLPSELRHIPFADSEKIVLRSKRLTISKVNQPYNPSIVRSPEGYILTFRNDIVAKGPMGQRQSCIAKARLNSKFRQIGKTVFFHTEHAISEDPRSFMFHEQLYLSYTHVHSWYPYETYMAMGRVQENELVDVMDLQYHPCRIEKNWVPFVYSDQVNGADVYFVYSCNPYKIMRLSRSFDGTIEDPFVQSFEKKNLTWEAKWGKICGGSPARLIDGEYVTFFHSSFKSNHMKWYVVGAYTFESHPPFRIKRISKYPILWKKIYQTPIHPTVWFRPRHEFRVAFPSGFEEGMKKGRQVLYLSYGENDSGLCVLTLDKNRLMNSLQDIEAATRP